MVGLSNENIGENPMPRKPLGWKAQRKNWVKSKKR